MGRILIIVGALAIGGLAAMMVGGGEPPPVAPAEVKVEPTEGVLVAAGQIEAGVRIQSGNLTWAEWPKAAASGNGLIRRSEHPNAMTEIAQSVSRTPFLASEPIRRERLVTGAGGFLSAVLPPGARAVAINIDQNGATTAGGFILPNDRVDVISTLRESGSGSESFESRVILANVRVLAIGQNIQERNGERVVTGSNATLAVDPRQAEILVQHQRQGHISLALRSMMEKPEGTDEDASNSNLTVVRFGAAANVNRR